MIVVRMFWLLKQMIGKAIVFQQHFSLLKLHFIPDPTVPLPTIGVHPHLLRESRKTDEKGQYDS
jgi:hypothetical protein